MALEVEQECYSYDIVGASPDPRGKIWNIITKQDITIVLFQFYATGDIVIASEISPGCLQVPIDGIARQALVYTKSALTDRICLYTLHDFLEGILDDLQGKYSLTPADYESIRGKLLHHLGMRRQLIQYNTSVEELWNKKLYAQT